MRWSRAAAVVTTLVLLTAGCSSTDGDKPGPAGSSPGGDGITVVASTSWVGALAKAAGAPAVTVIAPANVQHPPDYDPKPSDLAAVAGADYILYAEFDGFAAKIKEAAGGSGKLVPVELENTPAKIRAEVTRLGAMFDTASAAATWLSTFDTEFASLSSDVKAKLPTPPPVVVAHLFMGYWGDFAGLRVQGTYGPEPVTPGQLVELTAKKPTIVLANSHIPGANPEIPGAKRVHIVNFPADDLDLLGVFRTNAQRLTAAVAS